jgi:2-polyprenyl-3-methyl-5-hydroxy-6-metoxy-1,4-benzoquinol methylase
MLGLRLVHDPARQWERFGRMDPYYGVYAVEEMHRSNLDEDARERFFASGDAHVTAVLESVGRYAGSAFAPRTILDHGCGVGRLVVPFAERAQRVVGVDVSPSMLAEARRNCETRDLVNVEFLAADLLGTLAPEFDLVHSHIVLQHIPPRHGEPIFETLASLVAPGGVGVVQIPIAARHWLAQVHTWATRTLPLAYNLANAIRGRPWDYPHMQMNIYRLNSLALRLVRHGFDLVHLELRAPGPSRLAYADATLIFARSRDQASARS